MRPGGDVCRGTMLPQASMKQALYIIIALMQISFFAFNFQRWKLNRELKVFRTEVQMIATGVAAERLDEIATMDFADIYNLRTGSGDPLTVEVDFDEGNENEVNEFAFEVHTDVQYVEKQGAYFVPSNPGSSFQEVTLTISALMNDEIAINSVVTTSRIYSQTSN